MPYIRQLIDRKGQLHHSNNGKNDNVPKIHISAYKTIWTVAVILSLILNMVYFKLLGIEGCKFPTKRNTIFYNLKYNTKLVYIYRFARLNVTSNRLLINGFFYWHFVRQKMLIASLDDIGIQRFVRCCNLTRDWLISFFNQLQMWPFIQVVKHNLQCLAYHIIIPYLQYRSVASIVL